MRKLAFIGLFLFLIFTYLEPSILFPALGQMRVAFFISIITLILCIIGSLKPPRTIQNKLFLMFLFVTIISIILSPIPFIARTQAHLTHFSKAIALYFLVCVIVSSKEYLLKFYYMTFGFGLLISTVSLLTVRAAIEPLKGGKLIRMTNFFGGIGDDPNEMGVLLLAMFPLPLYMISQEKSVIKKIFYVVAAVIFLLCIIRTRSRGAFVGLLVVFAVLLWDNRKKVGTIVLILLIGLYGAFHAHESFWERMLTMQSKETIEADYSAFSRIIEAQYAIDLIKTRPLLGFGIGNFKEAKVRVLHLDESSKDADLVTHNTYLELAAETGIIGLLFFLTIVFLSLRYFTFAIKIFGKEDGNTNLHFIAKSLRAGFLGVLVTLFFLSEEFNRIIYQWIALAVVLKYLAIRENVRTLEEETEHSVS
jgi:O-antigen ligase